VCWISKNNSKIEFSCVLCAHSQFLCSLARFDFSKRGVRQPVHPHLLYARLLIFDKALAQPQFSAVNRSDELMSVLYSLVLTHRLIFLQLRTVYRSVGCIFLR